MLIPSFSLTFGLILNGQTEYVSKWGSLVTKFSLQIVKNLDDIFGSRFCGRSAYSTRSQTMLWEETHVGDVVSSNPHTYWIFLLL